MLITRNHRPRHQQQPSARCENGYASAGQAMPIQFNVDIWCLQTQRATRKKKIARPSPIDMGQPTGGPQSTQMCTNEFRLNLHNSSPIYERF